MKEFLAILWLLFPFTMGIGMTSERIDEIWAFAVFILWIAIGCSIRVAFLENFPTRKKLAMIFAGALSFGYFIYFFSVKMKQIQFIGYEVKLEEYMPISIPFAALVGEIVVSSVLKKLPVIADNLQDGAAKIILTKLNSVVNGTNSNQQSTNEIPEDAGMDPES